MFSEKIRISEGSKNRFFENVNFFGFLVEPFGFLLRFFGFLGEISGFLGETFGFLGNLFWISYYPQANALSNQSIVAWVTQPERTKGAKDEVKKAQRAPRHQVHYINTSL